VGIWHSNEAVVLVEVGGTFVYRDHDDKARGDYLSCGYDPAHRVRQQDAPETAALQCAVEREACQQHRGYSPRPAATECGGKLITLEQMRGDRVVRHDTVIASVPHERACRPPFLGGAGVLCEPSVQLLLAAVERGEVMALTQRLRLECW
jgi:hypothetical protein